MEAVQIAPEEGREEGLDRPSFGEFEHAAGFILRIAQVTVFERMFEELADNRIKFAEFTILLAISENPGVRQGAIADVLKIKWSNMTKLARALEQQGLVKRFVPPNDRRSVELRLTAAGRSFLETVRPLMSASDRHALSMLTQEEYAQFLALLRKVSGWQSL